MVSIKRAVIQGKSNEVIKLEDTSIGRCIIVEVRISEVRLTSSSEMKHASQLSSFILVVITVRVCESTDDALEHATLFT